MGWVGLAWHDFGDDGAEAGLLDILLRRDGRLWTGLETIDGWMAWNGWIRYGWEGLCTCNEDEMK
jgi:hypothetical protein